MWPKMFNRLLLLFLHGVPFTEAVETVANTTPEMSHADVYYAAVAAQAHMDRELIRQFEEDEWVALCAGDPTASP